MARIEWVRLKLENWSRWATERQAGASGFPRQSAFARWAASEGPCEARVPTDSIDAARTHDAIESLRHERSGLWLVLQCHYLGDPQARPARRRPMLTDEIALRMCIGRRAVQLRLEAADAALAELLRDRSRGEGGFTPFAK